MAGLQFFIDMTRVKQLLVLPIFFLVSAMPAQASDFLDRFRWEHRVLLVFVPEEKVSYVNQFRQELLENRVGFRERDLVVFSVEPTVVRSLFSPTAGARVRGNLSLANDLRQRFAVAWGTTRSILIGLDGGQKMRRAGFVDHDELFTVIDEKDLEMGSLLQLITGKDDNHSIPTKT